MLILVRHGESTGNAQGLLLGRIDAPLSERGLAQARTVGPAIVPGAAVDGVATVDRVITSPLSRARATAEALELGMPLEVDDRWIEMDYGEFDGRPLGAVPDDVWARWRTDADYRPPGGESLAEVGLRVRRCCQELFVKAGSGARSDHDVVVVSHVTPIKAAVCWALGLEVAAIWRLYLATASVTRIGWGPGGPVLHRFNETPWKVAPS